MTKKYVLPVVHHRDYATSRAQGQLALAAGADGVFLISHGGDDDALFAPAQDLKETFPDKLVGLNLLGSDALTAFDRTLTAGLDMVWADAPAVTSAGAAAMAQRISAKLAPLDGRFNVFGSVAFKYQPHEPNPPLAALLAWQLGMVPTTSGTGTGHAPAVSKISAMKKALSPEAPLAIASGMTPENVRDFLPHATHLLVATGISTDSFHFCPEKLHAFIHAVREFEVQ